MTDTLTEICNTKRIHIAAQKQAFQAHLDDVQANYLAQFNALSASVASMTSTQDFLTQQFAQMAKG